MKFYIDSYRKSTKRTLFRLIFPKIQANSIQACALTQTLEELRELRDGMFREDECSAAGLLFAQITLILERIEHGIPSGREPFLAVLRASQLPEPVPEAVEA